MIVRYQRSGGFTGMQVETTVDVESLPATEREELVGLVESAGFFDLPAAVTSTGGADEFVHIVTVESAQGTHTVEVTGAEVSDPLSQLLGLLGRIARRPRSQPDPSDQ